LRENASAEERLQFNISRFTMSFNYACFALLSDVIAEFDEKGWLF